jgi:pyruvate,water dikinase
VLAEDVPERQRDECCLTDGEIAGLVAVGRRIEAHYGTAQDIEWAITAEDQIVVLQSRPETVWSRRETNPVAPPRATAFDHILDVLGGRRT